MSDFSELTAWLKRIDEQLDDNGKRQLNQRIATKLKQQWSRRIRSQIDPSGAGFVPRKVKSRRFRTKQNRIKTGAMFIRAAGMLKTAYSSHHAEIGFAGRLAQIMAVHQYGQVAKPSPNVRAVQYAKRETVGFSSEDEQLIIEEIENFFMNLQ